VGHPELQELEDQELEGLYMGQDCVDRREQADLEGDPVVDLEHVEDHCMCLYADTEQMNGSHHVRLGCYLYRLEEDRRRVGLVAHIRTEDAAAGHSLREEVEAEVEEEGSCIDLT
jgi:hypothetical protein